VEVSGQLQIQATSLVGKVPRYPLVRRLGGPQSWSGCGGVKIKTPFIALARNHK